MKSPAFQFYPKQWLGDDMVMLMDWDARAMHVHYMCIAWQQQPPCTLPDDDEILRKWVGNPNDWDRLKKQIFRAWTLENNRWIQKGLLREYQKQNDFRQTRSENAKKRWDKNIPQKDPCTCIASAEHVQCSSSSSSTADIITPIVPLNGDQSDLKLEVEPSIPPDIWTPTPIQRRFNKMLRRKDTTPWDENELKALKKLGDINAEDLEALEKFYTANLPDDKNNRRREILTLLRHFNGELDKARNFKPAKPF